LAVLPGREGPLAYLIHDPPAIDKAVMERVQVFEDPASGLPMVAMVLAQPFRSSFADLTRSQLGRRLAILVNGEIRTLPVVQSAIESGNLRIEPSPVADPKQARPQAEALASGLNAWALARRLTLVRLEVTGGSPAATP
jgi:preprotein translocase subunit SecD